MRWLPVFALLRRPLRSAPPLQAILSGTVEEAAVEVLASKAASLKAVAPHIFEELNSAAFNSALPSDLALRWNPRLRRTAGRCHFISMANATRAARIELSPRVLDTPERLRITLAHEMCHAAHWLVDGVARPPHGSAFRSWARLVEERVGLKVTRTHSFEVHTRYRYSCLACGQCYGRHSRSLDLRTRVCHCGGELRFDGAFGRGGAPIVATGPTPAFAIFVQAEYAPLRRRWPRVTHQRIMQELGKKWRSKARLRAAAARSGGEEGQHKKQQQKVGSSRIDW